MAGIIGFDIKNIVGNSKELEEGYALQTVLVDIDDVLPTDNNPYLITDENVKLLADNIEKHGLISPICAVKVDGLTEILSGERRFRALKLLYDEGKKYTHNGVDITGQIPVEYVDPTDELEKMQMIISANASRDMTKDEKNKIVDLLYVQMMQMIEDGSVKESEIGIKAHWISVQSGISEHFCKDRLAFLKKQGTVDGAEEVPSESLSDTEGEEENTALKDAKIYIKALKQIQKKIQNIDICEMLAVIEENPKVYNELKTELQNTIPLLNSLVDEIKSRRK